MVSEVARNGVRRVKESFLLPSHHCALDLGLLLTLEASLLEFGKGSERVKRASREGRNITDGNRCCVLLHLVLSPSLLECDIRCRKLSMKPMKRNRGLARINGTENYDALWNGEV